MGVMPRSVSKSQAAQHVIHIVGRTLTHPHGNVHQGASSGKHARRIAQNTTSCRLRLPGNLVKNQRLSFENASSLDKLPIAKTKNKKRPRLRSCAYRSSGPQVFSWQLMLMNPRPGGHKQIRHKIREPIFASSRVQVQQLLKQRLISQPCL